MSFAFVAQESLREPLAAPIERGDRKAALLGIAHHFEVFFDKFGAAVEDAQRTLATRRGCPARKAQRRPVGCLDHSGDRTLGNRVVGDGNELHGWMTKRSRSL
jgi:hypothetical protein